MSTQEKLITARLGMPALAEELQNISKTSKVANLSRSHYYEIKKDDAYGKEELAPRDRDLPPLINPDSELNIPRFYAAWQTLPRSDSPVIHVV